jgi:hypothetical protein
MTIISTQRTEALAVKTRVNAVEFDNNHDEALTVKTGVMGIAAALPGKEKR